MNMRAALPNLPPEVWRNILTCLRCRPASPEETVTVSEFPPGQKDLARVLRVNSAFYEIAAPLLYESVVTQNLPALLYGVAECDTRGYLEEFRRQVQNRRCLERQLSSHEAPPGGPEEIAILNEGIREQLHRIQHLHKDRPIICPQSSIATQSSSLRRTCKSEHFARMRQLQIGCPEVVMGAGPMSVSMSTLGNSPFFGPRMLARLEFYVGLYQALEYLANSTSLHLDKLEHICLGWTSRRAHLDRNPLLVADCSRDIECSTALRSIYDSITQALSAFFDRTQPSSVCLGRPHGFIRLGTPQSPLRASWPPKSDGKTGSPMITLHNFLTLSAANLSKRTDRLGGHRSGHELPVTVDARFSPGTNAQRRQAERFYPAIRAAAREPSEPSDWSSSDLEIVIDSEGVIEEQMAVGDALASFLSDGNFDDEDGEAMVSQKARERLDEIKAIYGSPSRGTRIRILTGISQSPWGPCACGNGW